MTAHLSPTSIAAAAPAPPQRPLHVVIIGGGIGGLTLAQGLSKSGVSVAVYERDGTSTDRVQGYRVHINPTGSAALHDCVLPHLFDAFARTCGKPTRGIRFLTERGRVLLALNELNAPERFDAIAQHRSVSRITLRQVLLSGLEGVVHFGKAFVRYEASPIGRIVAHFEDGTTADGDVLVAADGGASRVRRQFLPQAERIDTGILGIAGKIFLDEQTRRRVAPEFLNGLTLVSGMGGYCLFVALQDINGVGVDGFGGNDESAHAGAHFDNSRSYLMWAFGAKRERFDLPERPEHVAGEPLRTAVLKAMAARGWDEHLLTLVRLADVETINAIAIRSSVPVTPWQTQRITLLGDAIHSMTPYRGIGANVALKDAMRLCHALTAASRGQRAVLEAIHDYETGMIDYGFRAVRTSLQAMDQAIVENRLRAMLSRTALRFINRVPPLKRRMGEE
jgi:2-polyprenyl-6-methoxyphenol hydroxylase-like FAD-dependent oxidoreductase